MTQCINDKIYQDTILRLEQVIKSFRSILRAMDVSENILDEIENEAYNKEVEIV